MALNDQELKLAEFYANPALKETWGRKPEALLAAGYSESTAKTQAQRVFRKGEVLAEINRLAIRYGKEPGVPAKPGKQGPQDPDIRLVQTIDRATVNFNILDLLETRTEMVTDALGNQVPRRELQIVDLVEAQKNKRIDGRVLASVKITNTQKGQSLEFQTVDKLKAGDRLIESKRPAGLLGSVGGRGGATVIINMPGHRPMKIVSDSEKPVIDVIPEPGDGAESAGA